MIRYCFTLMKQIYSGYDGCFLHVLAVKRELEAEAAALAEKEKAAAAEVSVA